MTKKDWPVLPIVLIVLLVLAVVFAGVGSYFYYQLKGENLKLTQEKNGLQKQLAVLQNNLATTTSALQDEQAKTTSFADQLNNLAGTVGTLDKLSKTDRELLKKYSKIYFLNENYVPANLATITPMYLFNPNKPAQFHAGAWSKLVSLMTSAYSVGINLKIDSAYRSFGTQSSLKANYKLTYGTGANKFSADQGYSEHQLGTAVDFISASSTTLSINFASSTAGMWLSTNAYKYGLILSYPKNNAYYQYEPWHWRYVGVALATLLHNENKHFYDLPQRTIDQYLINIFD